MSSINLVISEEDTNFNISIVSHLHNFYKVAASDIFGFELNFISNFFKKNSY